MTLWYENSTASFLEYSLQESEKSGLVSRLNKFAQDSTACSNALLTGDVPIGYGPGIVDGLFDDVRLDSPITSELQDQTVMSDNTNISCYLAAINPLAPLATLRNLLSRSGISTRVEYEAVPDRGSKMYAVAASYYFSLALYPAIKSSADYSAIEILGHFHFFFSTAAISNPEYQQFWTESLREPLVELLFFEGTTEEAQIKLISIVRILSSFDFSDFVPAVFEDDSANRDDEDPFDQVNFLFSEVLNDQVDVDSTEAAARAGDTDSQFIMGKRCLDQESPMFDADAAATWFRSAAEQGHVLSQNELGIMLVEGNLVPKNVTEGITWLVAASEQGDSDSQYCLAKIYLGEFGEAHTDYAKAGYWFFESAKRGDSMSQFELGIMYQKGLGIDKDISMGFVWILIAAKNGCERALYEVDQVSPNVAPDLLQSLNNYADEWIRGNSK